MTALLGRNGAGKTNVLKAIEWLARVLSTFPSKPEYASMEREPVTISVEFERHGHLYVYRVARNTRHFLDGDKARPEQLFEEDIFEIVNGDHILLLERRGEKVSLPELNQEVSVSLASSAVVGLVSILPQSEFRLFLLRLMVYFGNISYFPVTVPDGRYASALIDEADYKKWSENIYNNLDSGVDGTIMRIIQLYLEDNARYQELVDVLGDSGLQLLSSIDVTDLRSGERVGADGAPLAETRYFHVSFKPYGYAFGFSFKDLSFGTQRIIRLITYLLAVDSTVALIEQPEDGIHIALLHKVMPLVRAYSDGRQIILASHAPGVLDRLDPSEIRLVEIANGRTHLRSLSEDEIGAANEYLANEGPLSDFIESL
ncbi:ATP-binding protein [Paraburkholderia adhaesiva]|uniref:ATP-binding protein n=1 Tax=Paraburkholderia adhaesiva TaxID=2883244 RepID=UPI001F36470B|nr:ATP-binding protein [Paraburkholderia adhaesiva]